MVKLLSASTSLVKPTLLYHLAVVAAAQPVAVNVVVPVPQILPPGATGLLICGQVQSGLLTVNFVVHPAKVAVIVY